MSFLALEGLHCLVTGALGSIGSAIVDEFLAQGCKVTALDIRCNIAKSRPNLHYIQGDISDETSIASCISSATSTFGAIHILIANAGISSTSHNIWDLPLETWEKIHSVNSRGTFLTVKHFLRAVNASQQESGQVLPNLSIVVTGSECGKFGQEGHVAYASGKAGLQYGLVRTVKNEITKLNKGGRVNAVAPGWVDPPMTKSLADDPREMWRDTQATVALKKIAKPTDVARTVAFLASHKAAGHISGECISVDGGMEGRLLWPEDEVLHSSNNTPTTTPQTTPSSSPSSIPPQLPTQLPSQPLQPSQISTPHPRIKVLLTVDFDAVSGWLGTGQNAANTLADYSTGYFAAQVGVPRLLRLFKKLGVAEKVTWFVPGHSMESFPVQARMVVESGAEVAMHGYCHEGAYQLTPTQERDVLEHCIALCAKLTGRKPVGYRAPLYQIRESTVKLLEEFGFLYDSSLPHHDSTPYLLRPSPPIHPPTFTPSTSASTWMHPLPPLPPPSPTSLVELPGNWYMEDMTPLQYWPHTANSGGYVDVGVVEEMWRARMGFLRGELKGERSRGEEGVRKTGKEEARASNGGDGDEGDVLIFPLILHPDTSGMAHVIGMVGRFLAFLRGLEGQGEVEFCTMEACARDWKARRGGGEGVGGGVAGERE